MPNTFGESDVLSRIEEQNLASEPPMYDVIIHNDDTTPMELVVLLLCTVFEKPVDEAYKLMFSVHNSDRGVVGTYDKDTAYDLHEEAMEFINAFSTEFDLNCELLLTVEPH